MYIDPAVCAGDLDGHSYYHDVEDSIYTVMRKVLLPPSLLLPT